MMSEIDPWAALTAPSTREPRSLDQREASTRTRVWEPKGRLPDPAPQDGYVFKWVRAGFPKRGIEDQGNYLNNLDEGWEPVQAADHPEIAMSYSNATSSNGHVERGGLILCKMPLEMAEKRREYYSKITRDQTESAEDYARRDNNERAMRKFVEQRKQTFHAR